MSDIRIKMAKDLRDMSDMVGDLHWMAAKAVEDLTKKDGEIAKRDARILELESQYQRDVFGLNNEGDPIGGDPAGGYANDNARLRAELAAIKAQEPVAWEVYYADDDSFHTITRNKMLIDGYSSMAYVIKPLYAAPVSEAKAKGVVQWPDADEIMQMAFEEGQPADDASGYCFELEEFDLFIERLMSEVARLNAAHVQQVSVPDGFCIGAWRDALEKIAKYAPQVNCAARTELERAGLIAVHALIAFSAPQFRHARGTQTASNAAPAAPAADAGHVFYGMDGNHP